jgi:hypothetical protein
LERATCSLWTSIKGRRDTAMKDQRLTRLALTIVLGSGLLGGCAPDSLAPSPKPTPAPTPWPSLRPALTSIDARRANVVLVLVHSALADGLRSNLATLEQDLRDEGWDPEIQEGSASPPDLRRFLAESYFHGGLRAAFLIGDIPSARCAGQFYDDTGPCDLFLMDLDGEWRDTDGDGVLDFHGSGQSGNRDPEIAVGRLRGGNVSLLGKSEIAMSQDHLTRNHAFRRGQLATPQASLYCTIWDHHYGLYDPNSARDSWKVLDAQAALLPSTQALIYDARVDPAPAELWPYSNPEQKRTGMAKALYLELLGGGLDYVSVGGHGWHQGWAGLADVQDVVGLVRQGKPLPIMLESFGCTTAGIDRSDSLAAVMTMAGTLAFVGPSVITTSFPDWDVAFRQALADGTIGQAVLRYHTVAIAAQRQEWGVGDADLRQTYTATHRLLVGDPTLRLRTKR